MTRSLPVLQSETDRSYHHRVTVEVGSRQIRAKRGVNNQEFCSECVDQLAVTFKQAVPKLSPPSRVTQVKRSFLSSIPWTGVVRQVGAQVSSDGEFGRGKTVSLRHLAAAVKDSRQPGRRVGSMNGSGGIEQPTRWERETSGGTSYRG